MGRSAEMRQKFRTAAAALGAGGVTALGIYAFGAVAPLLAGVATLAVFALAYRMGADATRPQTRAKLFRVADELVQYRAFTRLLRAQGDRITGMTGDAAMAIGAGLRDMDERMAALVARIDALKGTAPDLAELHAATAAVTEPIVEMVGKLQFQDVTQQQLMFLCRLSVLVDDHMEELARLLGDRRSLDRTSRFQEMFDRALNDTVMASQRNDHHIAAGIELFEAAGPTVEMFEEGSPQ